MRLENDIVALHQLPENLRCQMRIGIAELMEILHHMRHFVPFALLLGLFPALCALERVDAIVELPAQNVPKPSRRINNQRWIRILIRFKHHFDSPSPALGLRALVAPFGLRSLRSAAEGQNERLNILCALGES